ncbi:hypothetical protein [Senegalia massiliensis]|uniref:Uncharacterized protein n=1 Tax=Senegalia massiliensis TaxID=1720316 RepID=A0A845R1E7_9CLOT|nr:hypothetical protein [Senegalia massiliensis]NBI07546.1 hypothetical protein [Senegalia massiliensis]
MNTIDILNKWAKFSKYEPNKNTWKAGSKQYELDKDNEVIATIMKYDSSSVSTCLYAKHIFKKHVSDKKFSILDILNNNYNISENVKEMWELFNSIEIIDFEKNLLEDINTNIDNISKNREIGDIKSEIDIEDIMDIYGTVIEDIDSCNYEVYNKGKNGEGNFVTNDLIYIFNSLKECILTIENSKDGIYLCFINNHETFNYFALVVKDGENIYSFNDRLDEKYPNQYMKKRLPGRDASRGKIFSLFPYDNEELFELGGVDYKGYSTNYKINNKNTMSIFQLGRNYYLPIVISMSIIKNAFVGKEIEGNITYLFNLAIKSSNNMLMEATKNQMAKSSVLNNYKDEIFEDFNTKGFLKGNYGYILKDYGRESQNTNQILIDLYSGNYQEDKINFHNKLSKNEILKVTEGELVGDQGKIKSIQYWLARRNLAEHIEKEMENELKKFGGTEGLNRWYRKKIKDNIDNLYKAIAEGKWIGEVSKMHDIWDMKWEKSNIMQLIDLSADSIDLHEMWHLRTVIGDSDERNNRYCPITGSKASIVAILRPQTWEDVAKLIGVDKDELPKLVKGWKYHQEYIGNSILDMIDPVEEIKHILMPRCENSFSFKIAIYLSKRGYAQICKKYNEDGNVNKFWINEN